MKLQDIVNKETGVKLLFGTGGALATLPAKKFLLSKVPFIKDKELYQDLTALALGVAIAAFSGNKNIKTAGLGMSLVSGFNVGRSFVQGAGLGTTMPAFDGYSDVMPIGSSDVMMGATNVLMGNASSFDGDSLDTTSAEAGEMNY